ncbi:MAG: phosphoribosyltransferase family protein [Candidatus Micrarchaeota archaeon]
MEEKELLSKAIELITKAKQEGLEIRLLGGLAIAYLSPNGRALEPFHRESHDIDLFSLRSYGKKISSFLEANGLEPDKRFNALYGAERQQYYYKGAKVDLLLDEFRMSHRLLLKNRISISDITLPPSDILLTKLQIAEINEKDIKDVLALLYDLKMGNADTHTMIDAGYIADILANDWGFYKTATINLEKINRYLESLNIEKEIKKSISNEIEYLKSAIELRPKSINWKLRAKIGERVRWYELPEELEARPIPLTELAERPYEWISFDEMKKISSKMANEIMSKYGKPRAILYIERGGMVIAKMLADKLGVEELHGVQIVAYTGINERTGTYVLPHYIALEDNDKGYILLVDDIADSGKTIKVALDLFSKKFKRIVTATLAYKPHSIVKPDIVGKTVPSNTWVIFDYEKNESLRDLSQKNDKEGIKLIEKTSKVKQKWYDELKEEARKLSEVIQSGAGTPSAILYMNHSGLILARLLSDFLNVRRVSSVMPNNMDNNYIKHVVDICKDSLKNSRSGFILLVDEKSEDIAKLKKLLNKQNPEIKVYTAALSKGDVDFFPDKH